MSAIDQVRADRAQRGRIPRLAKRQPDSTDLIVEDDGGFHACASRSSAARGLELLDYADAAENSARAQKPAVKR